MESKATKKTMLGDDELEQVSGGTVGVKGREPRVGDVASPVYNAELKEGPSDTSGTIRFLIFCQGMEILEILGDWYKVKVYRFLSQDLRQLFQRSFFFAAEKEHRITVSDYRVGIVLVDSL